MSTTDQGSESNDGEELDDNECMTTDPTNNEHNRNHWISSSPPSSQLRFYHIPIGTTIKKI